MEPDFPSAAMTQQTTAGSTDQRNAHLMPAKQQVETAALCKFLWAITAAEKESSSCQHLGQNSGIFFPRK